MGEESSAVSLPGSGRLSSIVCVVLLACKGIRSQCCHGYCSQLNLANGPYRLMAGPPGLSLSRVASPSRPKSGRNWEVTLATLVIFICYSLLLCVCCFCVWSFKLACHSWSFLG